MRNFIFPALLVLAASMSPSRAAVVLALDFQGGDAAPVTQSGFQSFTSNAATPTQTYTGISAVASGSLTVGLAGGSSSRLRTGPTAADNNGTFTYGELLHDLYTGIHPSANGTNLTAAYSLSITGLNPHTSYVIQLYSLDVNNNPNSIARWYDSTNTPANTAGLQPTDVLLGTITNNTTGSVVLADNNAYSVTGTVTSDATGALYFKVGDTAGTGIINGMILSTIPEPGTALLGLLGMGAFLGRRRR